MTYRTYRYKTQGDVSRDARVVGQGQSLPQRQDSHADQLQDLVTIANRFGLYDAADHVRVVMRMRPFMQEEGQA